MAGPEPYSSGPKMTQGEEAAYADGRKSAKVQGKGQPSRSGGRKRYVKTDAGARRYGQPIGTEIGNPRNKKAAQAQQDKESTGRYSELVGGDQKAQSAAMRGLNNDQLQRLSRVAYSFKSSDPNVVRLRIGVANELARRGMNVNDFGGLGRGSARPAGPATARPPVRRVAKRVPVKKPAPKPARSAMSARKNDRRLRELSVPQLRAAIRVFPKIPLAKRQAVARLLVRRSLELSAPHFLGESVIEAANLPDEQRTQVIELAGRWKHGYIPLDAVALESKMKGRTGGKRWWGSGGGKNSIVREREGGSGGTSGRLHSGIGVPKASSAEGRSRAAQPHRSSGNAWEDKYGKRPVRSTGNAWEDKYGVGANRNGIVDNKDTKNRYAAGQREAGGGSPAKLDAGMRDGSEWRKQSDGTYSFYPAHLNGRKSRLPDQNKQSLEQVKYSADQMRKTFAADDAQKDNPLAKRPWTPSVKSVDTPKGESARLATLSEIGLAGGVDRATPEQLKKARFKLKKMIEQSRPDPRWDTPQREADRKMLQGVMGDVNRALGSGGGSARAPRVSPADDPKGAEGRAIQYLEKNGAADTRARVRKLQAKPAKTSADKANIAALRRALNSDTSGSANTRNRLTPEQIARRSQVNRTPTGGLPEVRRKPGKA